MNQSTAPATPTSSPSGRQLVAGVSSLLARTTHGLLHEGEVDVELFDAGTSLGTARAISVGDLTRIAAVTHDANRRWCKGHGDHSHVAWEDAPDWQRRSAIVGVFNIAAGRVGTGRESHESWLREKQATGWTYGPVKNPDAKTHPCMVPYELLPAHERAKDAMFLAIATALLDAARNP